MRPSSQWRGVVRFLYNHNPFYLLSACLVLYGLQAAFHPQAGELIDPWALLAALSGYVLLSAITAFAIVRWGKVWEDARSLLLVLLFLFLALSVSFDEIVNTTSQLGQGLLLFGLCLSVVISEGLIRGLGIRFPWLYRGPYYLLLALFFGYPLLVSPEVTQLPLHVLRWRIMLFPTIAAIPFLALIPAVRRGADYTRPTGTPWDWPWVPWPVFVFLAVAVGARSYVLSISFDPAAGMNSTFGLYGLVPFCLVGLTLLLEIALVHQARRLKRFVMVSGFGLLWLSQWTGDGSAVSEQFLWTLTTLAGSPLYLTLYGLIGFYAYAWLRGVRFGEWGCVATLLLAGVIGPASMRLEDWSAPQLDALRAAGLFEFLIALSRRDSRRCFLGVFLCIAASALSSNGTEFFVLQRAIPPHLLLLATLVIGVTFTGRFAAFLRKAGAVLLPLICFTTLASNEMDSLGLSVQTAYLGGVLLVAFVHWWALRERFYLYSGGLMLSVVVSVGMVHFWEFLLVLLGPRALYPLAAGMGCFLLAVGISALKGGLVQRIQLALNRQQTSSP